MRRIFAQFRAGCLVAHDKEGILDTDILSEGFGPTGLLAHTPGHTPSGHRAEEGLDSRVASTHCADESGLETGRRAQGGGR